MIEETLKKSNLKMYSKEDMDKLSTENMIQYTALFYEAMLDNYADNELFAYFSKVFVYWINRRKDDDGTDCPHQIHRSLYKCIECIGQRHMADIDHRKPHQILRVRTGRDDIIVIRNELCMHAGFLTDRHDMLQLGILA